ncbi:MAG TPA: hypothetical protein VJ746_09435 [Nitrospira sp.]|nr:hypothetical protein [Nitrospira sp.]
MDVNIPRGRRRLWDPARILRWFSSPITTQLEAEQILRIVWKYFLVIIGLAMIGDVLMFLWGQSKGGVREFPLLELLGEAATLSVVSVMTARHSRSLAIVLFLSLLSIAGQSLHALGSLFNLSSHDLLMASRIVANVFLPLITMVISLVNALVMYKAVTATLYYHGVLNTRVIWKHVLMLGAVVAVGGLLLSIVNEGMWNALKAPLSLSDYSTEIEGRLNLCWLALACLLCSKLLASRFPMTKPVVIDAET